MAVRWHQYPTPRGPAPVTGFRRPGAFPTVSQASRDRLHASTFSPRAIVRGAFVAFLAFLQRTGGGVSSW